MTHKDSRVERSGLLLLHDAPMLTHATGKDGGLGAGADVLEEAVEGDAEAQEEKEREEIGG